jgi:ubiquinone/menaquinone biosynthesis C-methylase UbiE
MQEQGRIVGVDLDQELLVGARTWTSERHALPFAFVRCSIAALPFPHDSFDVASCFFVLNGTTPDHRRAAIQEAARILRPGGHFVLADWSRPRLGIAALLWAPILLAFEGRSDNWRNTYPEICRQHDLVPTEDTYLDSHIRCQVFHKVPGGAPGRSWPRRS